LVLCMARFVILQPFRRADYGESHAVDLAGRLALLAWLYFFAV